MKNYLNMLIAAVVLVMSGCSMHPMIRPEEAYIKIKPVAPLPEYEQQHLPQNLTVTVENVADMSGSYKNRLKLFVNQFQIEPDESYNFKSTYVYHLKLQPGVYKIRAMYYAYSGWSEQGFPIRTRDDVKIYLDKKAHLSVELEKNHWGAPVDKDTYFQLKYESIAP